MVILPSRLQKKLD